LLVKRCGALLHARGGFSGLLGIEITSRRIKSGEIFAGTAGCR
jgi:hypothetical protein